MLLLPYPIVAIGAGLAIQAAHAAPIRVTIVSSSIQPLDGPAPFHSPPFAPPLWNAPPALPKKHGCGGLRNKALDIANSLRKALGLELVETDEPVGEVHIMPFFRPDGKHPIIEEPLIKLVPVFEDKPAVKLSSFPPGPHHRLIPQIEAIPLVDDQNFVQRIHTALVALGPWEARAVAFVLGCGIGVLFRMIWVFAVLLFRKGPSEDESTEAQYALVIESANDAEEPPKYDSNVAAPGGFADEKSGLI